MLILQNKVCYSCRKMLLHMLRNSLKLVQVPAAQTVINCFKWEWGVRKMLLYETYVPSY